MATRIVSPTATGSGTGSLSNPWTVDQARRNQAPGDIIQCRGGSYTGSEDAINNSSGGGKSGTQSSPIVWEPYLAESPVFRRRWVVDNLAHISFEGLAFESSGDNIISGNTSNHLTWDACTFNATSSGQSYNGMLFRDSPFITIINCDFSDWLTGDFIHIFDSQRFLFKGNNANEARGGHSIINMNGCSRSVIHGNYFRNTIDRAISIPVRSGKTGSDVIVQWNVFVDCDWNTTDSHPFDGTQDENERGANETARLMVQRGILRYNLILLSNKGKDSSRDGALKFTFYSGSREGRSTRIFHNTIHRAISRSGFSASVDHSAIGTDFRDEDLRLINNVISNPDEYSIHIGNSQLRWRTWKFLSNLISDSAKSQVIAIRHSSSTTQYTVSSVQSEFPEVFKSNLQSIASFVDSSVVNSINSSPASWDINDLATIFSKMHLAGGSPGKSVGQALATVSKAAAGATTIELTDAVPFTTGWGLVANDEIFIGSETDPVEVLERPTDRTIRISRPVTVAVGDSVYHAVVGRSPDMGAPLLTPETDDPAPSPPPPPSTEEDTPEDNEDELVAAPPSSQALPVLASESTTFPNANPRLQKITPRLNLSGVSILSPVLSGLGGTLVLLLNPGERLLAWRIFNEDLGFENQLSFDDELNPEVDIIFGTDTTTSAAGSRNAIEWITTAGSSRRQLWVKDLPASGSLYVANQEAQGQGATFSINSGEPLSFGINILPGFGDEFFGIHEYSGNRYANTLRTWGGALTAEIFLGAPTPNLIISERYIGDIHGYYWGNPSPGTNTIRVRLRAAKESPNFVDIDGTITINVE